MEQENKTDLFAENSGLNTRKRDLLLPFSIVAAAAIIAGAWIYATGLKYGGKSASVSPSVQKSGDTNQEHLSATANPPVRTDANQTVEIPAVWSNLGARMIESGVIAEAKFKEIYAARGGLDQNSTRLLTGADNGKLKMNLANSGYLLNLLWALGLANKNQILEKGPLTDPQYGGAGRFASTGGWTLSQGDAMDHYSKHSFLLLSPEQQALVERLSGNIYRPCCDNSTYFPDCNHGMAMLGLLELMASQNVSETEMYRTALKVNSFWFPDQYATIANYLQSRGVDPRTADPKQILGTDYSSASGFSRVQKLVQSQPGESNSGGGCGV